MDKIADKGLTGRLHLSLGQGLDGDESFGSRHSLKISLLSTVNKGGRGVIRDVSIRIVVRVLVDVSGRGGSLSIGHGC